MGEIMADRTDIIISPCIRIRQRSEPHGIHIDRTGQQQNDIRGVLLLQMMHQLVFNLYRNMRSPVAVYGNRLRFIGILRKNNQLPARELI